MKKIETMKKTNFFNDLDDQVVQDISEFSELLILNSGDLIIKEGDTEDHDLFILVEGDFDVVIKYKGRQKTREMLLSSSYQEVIGEVAWAMKGERTTDLRSNGPAVFVRIDGVKLDAYLEANPTTGYTICRMIMATMAERLRDNKVGIRMLLQSSAMY